MIEHLLHLMLRGLVAIAVVGGVWIVVAGVGSSDFQEPERPQVVTLMDPRVPEREEPIIEPEPEPEPVDYEEPVTPADDIPELPELDLEPVDNLLGLDADASAGLDGFGLVAKRGGRDLIASASQTSNESLLRLGGLIERHLASALERREDLKRVNYTVLVNIWISKAGFVEKVEIDGSTGRRQLDDRISEALSRVPPFHVKLATVPQPVRIRITTRGAVQAG